MFNLTKWFKKKPKQLLFLTQMYPIGCTTSEGTKSCRECEYAEDTFCSCLFPFKEVTTSTVEEYIKAKADNRYADCVTMKDVHYRSKHIADKRIAQARKQQLKEQIIQVGAAYIAVKQLCEELGIDFKEL